MNQLTILFLHKPIHSFLTLLFLFWHCAKCNSQNRTICNMIYFKSRVTDYNWYAASEYCDTMEGQLANIDTDQAHQVFVRYLSVSPSFTEEGEAIWLGAYGYPEDMKWSNKKLVNQGFQNWAWGHPVEDNMCISVQDASGMWQSTDCDGIAGAAYCEKCIEQSCKYTNCSFICMCRNSMSCVVSPSKCQGGCVLAAMSNITKMQCPRHRYGPSCEGQCFCDKGVPCDSFVGDCPGSCLLGWHGSKCEETSCPHKKWGPNCELYCFCGNNLQCNEATGECLDGCMDGVSGVSCNHSLYCPINKWGDDCSKICHCSGSGYCNSKTGNCLDDTEECKYEFEGPSCSATQKDACPLNSWGTSCNLSCFCKDSMPCYRANGACEDGCIPGVGGPACNQSIGDCPLNRFGPDCLLACHCAESRQCHPETGICLTYNRACDVGWTGEACSESSCQLHFFGPGCQQVCYCDNKNHCPLDIGVCPDGHCINGWTGVSCNESDCGEGLYGLDCQETCECPPDEYCNKVTGECMFSADPLRENLMHSFGCTPPIISQSTVVLVWLIVYTIIKLLLFFDVINTY